jgi:hypothetical protein
MNEHRQKLIEGIEAALKVWERQDRWWVRGVSAYNSRRLPCAPNDSDAHDFCSGGVISHALGLNAGEFKHLVYLFQSAADNETVGGELLKCLGYPPGRCLWNAIVNFNDCYCKSKEQAVAKLEEMLTILKEAE